MGNNNIDSRIIETLKKVSFFQTYKNDEDVLNKISKMCSTKSFSKGKNIIKEGESGDELFILLNGEIEILKNTLQNEKYTVTTLSSEIPGVYVGEMGLIDNDRRSATVIAKTDCDCLVINRDNFIKFGNDNPEIALSITRIIASQISSRLRKATADVITLFSALVEEIAEDD